MGEVADGSSCRLILYFPVSALMTLFGNILQNPLDPRAKSDARLMSLVVNFLSMLGQEAEQGGVHRMLGICSEFVRIAKVVIDKAEREQSSRCKRKRAEVSSKPSSLPSAAAANGKSSTPRPGTANVSTPTPTGAQNAAASHVSPTARSDRATSFGHTPGALSATNEPSPSIESVGWPQEPPAPQNGDMDSYHGLQGFGGGIHSPSMAMKSNPLQQPLLPQDLFGLLATLDWNWAEMSGGAYPSVENGNFGEGPSGMH